MSSAEARRRREEKILANAGNRMKFISGEKVAINEEEASAKNKPAVIENVAGNDSSSSSSAAPMITPEKKAEIPRWEQKHVSSASAVTVTRELSEDLLAKLEKTEQMAVEAPKAAADPNIQARVKSLLQTKQSRSIWRNLKYDSLLSSLAAIYLGYLSGLSNGDFIRDNLWLPFGSIMLFALFLRVLLSVSLTRLRLVPSKSANQQPGFFMSAIASRIPVLGEAYSRISSVSGYFKDSYDDMMLFIFAHGLTAALAAVREEEEQFVS